MDDLPVLLYGSALGTGLVFGYVIQRGGFCLTRALSNALLMRDATILRAYGLALLVAMVGVEILEVLAVPGAPVGGMIAVGWWASALGERPIGITFAANTGHLFTYPLVGYPNRVTWSMVMALGVPVGAFVAAWTTSQFGWKLPAPASLVKIFCGGLLMGAAALIAEGCNINQGLTNSATLALGSLLAFASMCAG